MDETEKPDIIQKLLDEYRGDEKNLSALDIYLSGND